MSIAKQIQYQYQVTVAGLCSSVRAPVLAPLLVVTGALARGVLELEWCMVRVSPSSTPHRTPGVQHVAAQHNDQETPLNKFRLSSTASATPSAPLASVGAGPCSLAVPYAFSLPHHSRLAGDATSLLTAP